jgi:hypothetical protein
MGRGPLDPIFDWKKVQLSVETIETKIKQFLDKKIHVVCLFEVTHSEKTF